MFEPTISDADFLSLAMTRWDINSHLLPKSPDLEPSFAPSSPITQLSSKSPFENKAVEQILTAFERQKFLTQPSNENLLASVTSSSVVAQSDKAGNTLASAKAITVGTTATSYSDWVGTTDTNDYYKFSVTEAKNFSLSLTGLSNDADVQLLSSNGTTLASSTNYGSNPESINVQLLSGTYYIRVYPDYGNTAYTLKVSAANTLDAGNTLASAKAITVGATTTSYSDWVGATDTNDYYRFSVTEAKNFSLSLSGLANDADVQLLSSNGTTLASSTNYGSNPESINVQLLSGTYYIRVYPDYGNTAYTLKVSAANTLDAGNTLASAKAITVGTTATSYSDWVGATDTNDYYKFSVTEAKNFSLSLTGLSNDADVQLLSSNGTTLASSTNYGSNAESINVQLLSGTYYIRVYPDYGNTAYTLKVSAANTLDAGNTLASAKAITVGATATNYSDWVGATDTNDYYKFSVTGAKNFSLSLTGLSNDADVQLLSSNGTTLASSTNYGSNSESINFELESGTYYIRVYPDYGNTAYNLSVSATPIVVIPGYSKINGYGLVNAAAAVAKALNQNPFPNVPDLGGNNWGADLVKAPEVWAKGYTGQGIVVAVLDTGVDRNHTDLDANIWKNTKEIANNGKDDDKNGYIDDVYGWNFDSNNNNTLDGHSHGTHVSGTIAAEKNSFGVTGIAYNAKIMPVKVLSDSGSGSESGVAKGIRYAADNGAHIINMSLGGDTDDPEMRAAVEYASSKGVIVVSAAGNDDDSTTMGHYPAAYANKWGFAIGAVDEDNEMAYFSNRAGSNPLAYVTAPGVNVYSTVPDNSYDSYSGTSMATPHVAGVIALLLDAKPNLTDAQVRQIITDTAS